MKFCSKHAKEGMIDLKKCAHGGCNKQPSFGVAGTKNREFCRDHAKEGMVDVKSEKCAHQGCSKVASIGVEGSNKAELCKKHAKDGMVLRHDVHGWGREAANGFGTNRWSLGRGG